MSTATRHHPEWVASHTETDTALHGAVPYGNLGGRRLSTNEGGD